MVSVLAVAGEGGVTRDKLAGLFWPEYAPERARHSLTQALYAARKASGCDDLFVVSEVIRLDFDQIDVDVRDFEDAVAAGNVQRAVELYRGPFLDGFYLQPPEFEQWLMHERLRLEDQALSAMSRLTDALEAGGELARAVEQARRMAAARPTDATIAKRLMHLLADAGDRAAAVVHASTYATIVRERFDVEPNPDVLALAEAIKSAPVLPPAIPEVVAADAVPSPEAVSPQLDVAAATLNEAAVASARPPWRQRLRAVPRAWLIGAGAAVIAVTAILIALLMRDKPPAAAMQRGLVIAPFRVTAADARLGYLADGMIELLSARFADDTSAQALDAAAQIRAWHQAGISGTRTVSSDSILQVARRLGAERVITGSVVGSPERIVVNAAVLSADSGGIISKATAEGSTDSLTALVDDVARRLLVTQINAQDQLADRTTMSLPALRAYIDGSAAFAERDYVIAFRSYQRAVDLDSTFALAALKLAITAERIGEFDRERLALQRAWNVRSNLSERDRAHVVALLGPRYPALSTVNESLAAWTRAARLAPDRPDVWNGLAAASYVAILAGIDVDQESVLAALRRAIALDSNFAEPRTLLARIQDSTYVDAPARLADAGPAALRRLVLTSQFAGTQFNAALAAISQLESRAADAEDAMNLLLAEHSLLMLRGDPAAAFEITRSMQRLSPATRAHLRLRVLDAIYGNADPQKAAAAAAQLANGVGIEQAPADACVLGQWKLANNDIAGARAVLGQLFGEDYNPVIVGVHPAVCSELLQTGIAVQEQPRSASTRLQRLDSLNFTSLAAGDAAAYANIAIARWHLELKEPEKALAAVRRRPYSGLVWPRYQSAALQMQTGIAQMRQRPAP